MFSPGSLVENRYEVIAALPSHALYLVRVRAHDRVSNQTVELFALEERFARHSDFVDAFVEEATRAAQLTHPHIARIRAVVHQPEGNLAFVVFDSHNDVSLADSLATAAQASGSLSANGLHGLASELHQALTYAGSLGFVHGALSPETLSYSPVSGLHILGFGVYSLASRFSPSVDALATTLGGRRYLSTEQLEGVPITPATDNEVAKRIIEEFVPQPATVPVTYITSDSDITPAAVEITNVNGINPDYAKIFPKNALSTRDFQANEFTAGRTRRAMITTIVLALVSVLVLSAGVLWAVSALPSSLIPSSSRTVPAVTGLTLDEAISAIKQAGLAVEQNQVMSSTVTVGSVVTQQPPAGASVESGSIVSIGISSGAQTITVPDVTGMSLKDASATLTKLGFSIAGSTPTPSALAPTGSVVTQQPVAGAQVLSGSAVTLGIADGNVVIPNLVGKPVTQATQTLQSPAIGIFPKLTADKTCTTTTPPTVVRQDPVPSTVKRSSSVTLIYCTGH